MLRPAIKGRQRRQPSGKQLPAAHRGMAEFIMLQPIGLLLVMLFPGVALWFAHWLYGK